MIELLTSASPVTRPGPAWSTTLLTGVALPILILLALAVTSSPVAAACGPVFTLGLMGVGIIAAATAGRFWVGVLLGLLNAACLVGLAIAAGMPAPSHVAAMAFAMVVASFSFAARGALFSKTMTTKGWLMALFVVAGEASVLLIVATLPDLLPDWFLALLPAQWASIAIQSGISGAGAQAAGPVLIALAGTAATTLLAARFWMKPWPYPLMFTTWLGLSALVYFSS